MGINPLAVNVGVSVTHANVSVLITHANVNVMVPVTKLDYIELHLSTSIDITGRYRYISEVSVVIDALHFHFAQSLKNSVDINDSEKIVVAKNSFESLEVTDVFLKVVSFARNFTEFENLTDAQQLQVAKAITDGLTLADAPLLLLYKAISDGVAINDSADLADGITFQAVKSVMNLVFAGDIAIVDFSKQIADNQFVIDAPSLELALFKSDYVALSNKATSETNKVLFDSQMLQDAVQFSVNKAFANTVTLVGLTTTSVIKPLIDVSTATDATSYLFTTQQQDTTTLLDNANFVVATDYVDSALITSIQNFRFNSAYLDIANFSDAIDFNLNVNKSDSVSLSETFSKEMISGLTFSDAFGLNDSTVYFDGLNTQFVKLVSNVAFVNDNEILAFSITKANTVSTSDIGALVNQGYCDFTYFATDYIGETRVF